jgi:hypothetical protein
MLVRIVAMLTKLLMRFDPEQLPGPRERSRLSPKISQAKALVRFSRYGAAQEAALEENRI